MLIFAVVFRLRSFSLLSNFSNLDIMLIVEALTIKNEYLLTVKRLEFLKGVDSLSARFLNALIGAKLDIKQMRLKC